MMRRPLALLPVLLIVANANAWNAVGHAAVASIAYDVLKAEHPKTLAKVIELVKQNPLPELEAKQIEGMNAPADGMDKAWFMAAARFPDDVKRRAGIKGYNHPTWHYYDQPLSAAGDSTSGPQPE